MQPVPETVQVTAELAVAATDAVNCWVVPTIVDAVAGVTANAATPAPVTPTTAVPFAEALLDIVSCPVAAPAAVGSNDISTFVAWFGLKVIGNAGPDTVKPSPVKAAPSIVTGAVPVEVNVIACVVGVFNAIFPNATLVGSTLSASRIALSCSE